MKDEPSADSKTTQERFTALGKQLLAVPRANVTVLEKKWKKRKAKRR